MGRRRRDAGVGYSGPGTAERCTRVAEGRSRDEASEEIGVSFYVLLAAGAGFLSVLAFPLWRMSPRGGGAEWALAWCALFASGLTLHVSETVPALRSFYPALGTAFAGLLYAGARRYCGRPVGQRYAWAVFSVAILRGALVYASPSFVTHLGAMVAIGGGSALATCEIVAARRRRRAGPAELLMVGSLPALAVTSVVYETFMWTGADLEFGAFLWLASGCFAAGTQLAAIFEQYRAELEARLDERSRQLRASQERLAEQERLVAVGTLAAGIAHQINNPIGAIVAAAQYAQLVGDDADGDGIRRDALRRVLDEARRCGRIVKSILQFARHEPTAKWTEDLNPTVRRAALLSRECVEGRGGAVDLKLTDESLPIWMSPIDLEQAIVNLIRNAAESSATGVRVEIETVCVGATACVYVSDDGRRIDPAIRSRLLEPFFTTRLAEGGSGLGLSVVHGIVTDHGGRLEIEARPQGGTRVWIELPIASRDAGEPEAASPDDSRRPLS